MLILIFGSKSSFGNDFGQSDTKYISVLCCILAKRLLEIALPMAMAKIPDDQKLFEIACYMLK